jgi:MscS family membrane protein
MRILKSPFIWSLILLVQLCRPLQAADAAPTVSAAPANAVVVATNNTPVAVVPIMRLSDETRSQLTFGLDKIAALQTSIFGFEAWQYIASLLYIFLAFAVARILDFVVGVILKKWAEKTATTLDDLLIQIVYAPVKIVSFVILLHIGLQIFRWPLWIETWISRGLHLILAGSLTYMLVKLVDVLVNHWRRRSAAREDKSFNDQLFPIISRTLKVFVVIMAVLFTSQNLGLNITGVLASLSIGGLALGLAAQDTVANLFGAVSVFIDKPFQIGDFIRVDQIEGTVETIGLRSTRIRNLDGHLITVPNKTMGNATIINVTRRPGIRTVMDIGLVYDTPVEKIRRASDVLKEVYGKHPQTTDLIVSFNQFTASSLNIRVIHFWKGPTVKDHFAALQEMNLTLKERFAAEGISFAYPTQTLFLKQDSPWNLSLPAPTEEKPTAS